MFYSKVAYPNTLLSQSANLRASTTEASVAISTSFLRTTTISSRVCLRKIRLSQLNTQGAKPTVKQQSKQKITRKDRLTRSSTSSKQRLSKPNQTFSDRRKIYSN